MMSSVIRQELWMFLLSVFHGFFLMLLYDVIRSLRRAFSHGFLLLSLEDFFYWTAAAFLTFCLVFSGTDGRIRGYIGAGIFLGAFFCRQIAERILLLLKNFVVKELNLKGKRGKMEAQREKTTKRGRRGSINESEKE